MTSRLLTATVGVALATCTLTLSQVGHATDKRTDQDCAELFKQLDTSKSGKLDATETAANPISQRAFNDPANHEKGYLAEADFTAVCAGTERTPASGQN
jgi:hypothetical protein